MLEEDEKEHQAMALKQAEKNLAAYSSLLNASQSVRTDEALSPTVKEQSPKSPVGKSPDAAEDSKLSSSKLQKSLSASEKSGGKATGSAEVISPAEQADDPVE